MMTLRLSRNEVTRKAVAAVILAGALSVFLAGYAMAGEVVRYQRNGSTTWYQQREGQAAVRYAKSAQTHALQERVKADAQLAGWEVITGFSDASMFIVQADPETVSRKVKASALPIAAVYPVMHSTIYPDNPIVVTEEILLRFEDDVTPAQAQVFLQKHQLTVVRELPGEAWLLAAPTIGRDTIALCMQLSNLAPVRWAEPNAICSMLRFMAPPMPNDTYVDNQWHLSNTKYNTIQAKGTLNADCDVFRYWGWGWLVPAQGENMRVAVLDEGVDLNHEDLKDNLVQGWDFVEEDPFAHPSTNAAHGTNCAGIIAAVTNNGIGVAGVAPKAKIIPVRIFDDSLGAAAPMDRIGRAIRWSVANGADILSNSWGLPGGYSIYIHEAFIHAARDGRSGKGAIPLAASGNEYGTVAYPAAMSDSVISVGAVSDQNRRVSYSNAGPNLDIVAPSQDLRDMYVLNSENRTGIWTTDISGSGGYNSGKPFTTNPPGDDKGNYYSSFNGTSAATPVAAGCVALLLGSFPDSTFAQIRERIRRFADPVGDIALYLDPSNPMNAAGDTDICRYVGFAFDFGFGRINPYRSLHQIPKPYPFRNVGVDYVTTWPNPADPEGWTTFTLSQPIVYLDEDKNEYQVNTWNLTSNGWEETLRVRQEDPQKQALFQHNPDGLYPPGQQLQLVSPEIPITNPDATHAAVVVLHRFSFEIGDAIDRGFVQANVGNTGWKTLGQVRGTSAFALDYTDEMEPEEGTSRYTLLVRQTFPVGSIAGAETLKIRFDFRSYDSHVPETTPPYFGWQIRGVKVVTYSLNEDDYLVNDEGKMPDWSADAQSIYFTNKSKDALFMRPVNQVGRWEEGSYCPEYPPVLGGLYISSLDSVVSGLDFSPVINRLATSRDTADQPWIAAVQSQNDDGLDGVAITAYQPFKAKGVRYSSDANWVVFTDGERVFITLTDGSIEPIATSPTLHGAKLFNIADPVFCFGDQRVVFSAAETNGGQRDLFILNRSTGRAQRLVNLPDTDEYHPDVSPDGKTVVFVSTAFSVDDPFPDAPGLYFLRNLIDVVNLGSPAYLEALARNPDGEYAWPRFSPEGSRIVYTVDSAIRIRKIVLGDFEPPPPPTPTPAPTLTPSPTPTPPGPTPTPIQEAVTKHGEINFSHQTAEWQLVTVPGFAPPTYRHTLGTGLTLVSGANFNGFGYLSSPKGFTAVNESAMTLTRFWISGSASSARALPKMRLRANSHDFQDAQMLEVDPRADASQAPSLNPLSPTAYDLLLTIGPGVASRSLPQDQFQLAFDQINIDPANDYNGQLIMHKIELYRIPVSRILNTDIPGITWTFNTGSEGWAPGGGEFILPIAVARDGALFLKSTDNTQTYGDWHLDDIPMNAFERADTLLKVDWVVFHDGLDADVVPNFRFRVFTSDFQIGASRQMSSTSLGDQMPTRGRARARTYTSYLRPKSGTSPATFNLGFDITNFNPNDLVDGELGLEEVRMSVVRVDDYPVLP